MAFPFIPVTLGVVGLGVIYFLIKGSGAKVPSAPAKVEISPGKEVSTVDLKTLKGYADGFNAGQTDGNQDGRFGLDPSSRPNKDYSSDPAEQKAYGLGYDAGYDVGYTAGHNFKNFTTDSTGGTDSTKTDVAKEKEKVGTPALRDKGIADGKSDGYYAGNKDQQDGQYGFSSDNRYHKLRNAVAGLAQSDAYKTGYTEGLDDGYRNGGEDAKHGVVVKGWGRTQDARVGQAPPPPPPMPMDGHEHGRDGDFGPRQTILSARFFGPRFWPYPYYGNLYRDDFADGWGRGCMDAKSVLAGGAPTGAQMSGPNYRAGYERGWSECNGPGPAPYAAPAQPYYARPGFGYGGGLFGGGFL